MTAGNWKPFSQFIGGVQKWIAGKQLNLDQPLHSGNVEYSGDYAEDHQIIQDLCDRLNAREEKGGK